VRPVPPAIEKSQLGIDPVEIMKHAADGGAGVIVERVLESRHGPPIAIDHQVLSHQPAGIREPLGESSGAGKTEQARRLRAVGTNNHRAGFLQMLLAPGRQNGRHPWRGYGEWSLPGKRNFAGRSVPVQQSAYNQRLRRNWAPGSPKSRNPQCWRISAAWSQPVSLSR
jgi:hypothetical protein